ncbi:LamG-like jellyroll fold domain-containing protein [Isoptericola aurantiacus]|uniref:LamG-like jellyroll fold domain-containing protein n=1 Tax=Isoptericola aurantiacus TaxID=3377839 RepID=UPI003839E3A4
MSTTKPSLDPPNGTRRDRTVALGLAAALVLGTAGAASATTDSAIGTAGTTAASVTAAPVTAAVPDDRTGLRGDYFVTSEGSGWALDEANRRATIVDPRIEFTNLVPVFQSLTGQGEQTAARWTGTITPEFSEEYTFAATGDNGMRLWIDDQLVIDHWVNDWDVEQTSTPVALEAGTAHTFRMEMFQATGGANMYLRWSSPSQPRQIVPDEAFGLPDGFEVFPAEAAISSAGTDLTVAFQDTVTGTAGLADHLDLVVDGQSWPLDSLGADGSDLTATFDAAIDRDATARLSYDGEGALAVGGEDVGELFLPVTNDSEFRITTPWADDFDPANPLPEYPRPQLVRDDWENLNGYWDYTAAQAGDTPADASYDEQIVVPYAVESALSGIERWDQHMFYRRTIEVPADWDVGADNRLRLNFGAVDYETTVWVDGTEVGTHRGGYDGFAFDVTDALDGAGEHEIVVGVTDVTDGSNQAVGKQTLNPGGIFYTPTSGIWQTVWMEPVPVAAIDQVTSVPDLDASAVDVTVESATASDGAEVTLTARDADGTEVGSVTGPANSELELPVPDAHLWTPDDPYLYDVDVELTDAGATDTAEHYVGMRSIEVDEVDGVNRVLLNGETTFLLSTLDQGYWPDGVYTPASYEAFAQDLQSHKDLGFNTVRKHIKVEPDVFYAMADEMGLMVWQDMPSGWFANGDTRPASRDFWEEEISEIVDEHRSFPSIIGWVVFNEGWGEWDLDETRRIVNDVADQDPSRLVDGHSGVNCCASKGDSGAGDIIDHHAYQGPATPKPDATRAAIDGEHGGLSLTVPGHMWPGGSVNPYGEEADRDALTAAYVDNTERLIRPAQCYLSGSVYTEISDVEGEMNGFWTYDRSVQKMDEAAVRDVNERVVAAARAGTSQVPDGTPGLTGTGWWSFDEGAGATASDGVGGATATLSGGAAFADGRDGAATALHLDGVDGFAATEDAVVDTQASYTVSAWVSLDRLPDTYWGTILGQETSNGTSAFFLQANRDGQFAFSYDGEPRAISDVDPVLGQWYHVTGVRDAEARTLTLYVNGEQVGESSVCGGFDATGPLTIGRGQWSGDPVDFWPGSIDDVRTFDRALDADEVAAVMAGESGPESSTEVTVQTRCVAHRAFLEVRVTNGAEEKAKIRVESDFGRRSFGQVKPGRDAVRTLPVRSSEVAAGEVTVTTTFRDADPQEVTAAYDGRTCG